MKSIDGLSGREEYLALEQIQTEQIRIDSKECPDCEGVGTLRVEELNPENGRYNDYDVECEHCEGTGELLIEQDVTEIL